MTKKELSQLAAINKEVAMYDQQVKRLKEQLQAECVSDTVHGSQMSYPYIQRVFSLEGVPDGPHQRRLKAKLNIAIGQAMLARERCIDEYNRLNSFIANINDSQMRQILSLRYINGLSWQQVAFTMGEKDESYPRRKHDRFLKLAENAEENVIE